jgi:hypothetical protein
MSIFYILAVFFAILTRVFFELKESAMIILIGRISLGCLISMIFSVLINTMMRSWIRFRDSLYKDEAYLTHTLPVTKSELYNSKFIQTLIFFFIGFIVILLCLFITFYSKETWTVITTYIRTITTGLNMSTTFFVLIAIIIIFLEVFNAIQCGFLGIIWGHKENNNKIIFSVLYGFVAYLLAQSLVLLLTYIVGLFNPTIMDLFKSNIVLDVKSFKLLMILAIIIYIIIILFMRFICKKEFNKGVNIE